MRGVALLAHSPHIHTVWDKRDAQEIQSLFKEREGGDDRGKGKEISEYSTVR